MTTVQAVATTAFSGLCILLIGVYLGRKSKKK